MTHAQLIEATKALIAIPSSIEHPDALQQSVDFIVTIIKDIPGITIEWFERNNKPSFLAYVGTERPARFDVILNGHVDVVPAPPEQFIAREHDGKLYGRGVYDMKMAAIIMADIFREQAATTPLTLGLQIVTDEEMGGHDGVLYQLEQGVQADFAISGEMTNLGVCNESRGICWAEITFTGRSAHSGYAWRGENAITQASEFAQTVLRKFPIPADQTWTTTANIAALTTTNATFNKVPDHATLKIDFRFTPDEPIFESKEAVEQYLKSINPTVAVALETFGKAVKIQEANPYLQRFLQVVQEVTGEQASLIKRYASSDARHFALHGQECIEFGLGGNDHHGADEHVELATVEPFRKTIELFLQESAAQKAESHETVYQLV